MSKSLLKKASGKLLIQTAEAKIFKIGNKIIKDRVRKGYRNPVLDKRIRKERTKIEARILEKLGRAGIRVPRVLHVDIEKGIIEMEFIQGKRLKDVFDSFSGAEKKKVCKEIGKTLGFIHNLGIIHGDVTLANIIKKGKELFWLDFGLAKETQRIEDFAVDLCVFKRTFLSTTHLDTKPWKEVERGYLQGFGKAKEVFERFELVEKRARYL